jgi:hypothetical protein
MIFFTFRSFRRFLSYSSCSLNFDWQHPFSRLGKDPVVARLSPRGGGMLRGNGLNKQQPRMILNPKFGYITYSW